MIDVEVGDRGERQAPVESARRLAVEVLAQEGIEAGELGLWFVAGEEMRGLKRKHLGIDEVTDVLSFPIDCDDELPDGVPRALGDVFLCLEVAKQEWRAPLVHGLLHLLGYVHGDEMERRERELLR